MTYLGVWQQVITGGSEKCLQKLDNTQITVLCITIGTLGSISVAIMRMQTGIGIMHIRRDKPCLSCEGETNKSKAHSGRITPLQVNDWRPRSLQWIQPRSWCSYVASPWQTCAPPHILPIVWGATGVLSLPAGPLFGKGCAHGPRVT